MGIEYSLYSIQIIMPMELLTTYLCVCVCVCTFWGEKKIDTDPD